MCGHCKTGMPQANCSCLVCVHDSQKAYVVSFQISDTEVKSRKNCTTQPKECDLKLSQAFVALHFASSSERTEGGSGIYSRSCSHNGCSSAKLLLSGSCFSTYSVLIPANV